VQLLRGQEGELNAYRVFPFEAELPERSGRGTRVRREMCRKRGMGGDGALNGEQRGSDSRLTVREARGGDSYRQLSCTETVQNSPRASGVKGRTIASEEN